MTATAQQTEHETAGHENGQSEKYNPHREPIGNESRLRQFLEHYQDRLGNLLPKHLSPGKMIDFMLIAANKNTEIYECTGTSIYQTLREASELGLSLSGSLGEAYPVTFFNKGIQCRECQLMIGYRGFVKLAYQTGLVKRIEAEVVHENDHFEYEKGIRQVCQFRPRMNDDRGGRIGVYALVELLNGGILTDFMDVDGVMKVKAASKASSYKGSPWNGPFDSEMWKKSVWRRLSKWTSLSSEKYDRALEVHDREFEFTDYEDITDQARERADALAQRLLDAKREPDITPEDFERARQERGRAAVSTDRAPSRPDTPPEPSAAAEAQQEPQPDPSDGAPDPADEVVSETIQHMHAEVIDCTECQTREAAGRCVTGVGQRYAKVVMDWPEADRARFREAYEEAKDEAAETIKELPPEARTEKTEPAGPSSPEPDDDQGEMFSREQDDAGELYDDLGDPTMY